MIRYKKGPQAKDRFIVFFMIVTINSFYKKPHFKATKYKRLIATSQATLYEKLFSFSLLFL